MNLRRWWVVFFLAVPAVGALAQGTAVRPAGTQFEQAEQLVRRADLALGRGEEAVALDMYRQGMDTYMRLEREFPQWQPAVTRARIVYCRDAVLSLLRRVPESELRPRHAAQQPRQDVTALCSNASALLRAGDAAGAVVLLLEALRADPDRFAVRLLLGMARCQEGRFTDAFFLLEPLVAEHPDRPEARLALAAAFLGRNDLASAQTEVEAALTLQPGAPEAHFNMARLLTLRGPEHRIRARVHYERSVALGGARDAAFEAALAEEASAEEKRDESVWHRVFGLGRSRRAPPAGSENVGRGGRREPAAPVEKAVEKRVVRTAPVEIVPPPPAPPPALAPADYLTPVRQVERPAAGSERKLEPTSPPQR